MGEKEKLIERLGCYLENKEQLAPLAARIMSKLILKGKQGATFENFVCELGASKSTISTHLTTLQASKRITYFTKQGDRKKYYIISPDAMIQSITDMLKNWNSERELHLEIMAYKKDTNSNLKEDSDAKFDLDFHTDYLEFLTLASTSMEKLRKKLTEKHKNA